MEDTNKAYNETQVKEIENIDTRLKSSPHPPDNTNITSPQSNGINPSIPYDPDVMKEKGTQTLETKSEGIQAGCEDFNEGKILFPTIETNIEQNNEQNIPGNMEQNNKQNFEENMEQNIEQNFEENMEQNNNQNFEENIEQNIEQNIEENMEQNKQEDQVVEQKNLRAINKNKNLYDENNNNKNEIQNINGNLNQDNEDESEEEITMKQEDFEDDYDEEVIQDHKRQNLISEDNNNYNNDNQIQNQIEEQLYQQYQEEEQQQQENYQQNQEEEEEQINYQNQIRNDNPYQWEENYQQEENDLQQEQEFVENQKIIIEEDKKEELPSPQEEKINKNTKKSAKNKKKETKKKDIKKDNKKESKNQLDSIEKNEEEFEYKTELYNPIGAKHDQFSCGKCEPNYKKCLKNGGHLKAFTCPACGNKSNEISLEFYRKKYKL